MTVSTWIVISFVLAVFYWIFYREITRLQKLKKVPLFLGILWFLFTCGSGFVWGRTIGKVFLESITTTEETQKQYVIDHCYDIKSTDVDFSHLDCDVYKIDTCLLPYWDDITIQDYKDSAYILFWGDRDSWKWNFNSDKGFWIYRQYGNSLVHDNGEYVMQTVDEQDANIFYILDELKDIETIEFPEPLGYVSDFENILLKQANL